jgi:hypothetical protein
LSTTFHTVVNRFISTITTNSPNITKRLRRLVKKIGPVVSVLLFRCPNLFDHSPSGGIVVAQPRNNFAIRAHGNSLSDQVLFNHLDATLRPFKLRMSSLAECDRIEIGPPPVDLSERLSVRCASALHASAVATRLHPIPNSVATQ